MYILLLTGGDLGNRPDSGEELTALIVGESELPELRDRVRATGTGTGDAEKKLHKTLMTSQITSTQVL